MTFLNKLAIWTSGIIPLHSASAIGTSLKSQGRDSQFIPGSCTIFAVALVSCHV